MTVIWTASARRDLRRLSRDVAGRVAGAVDRFAATGQGSVKRLSDAGGQLSLRVGDWRVLLTYEEQNMVIQRVRPRGRAYRD